MLKKWKAIKQKLYNTIILNIIIVEVRKAIIIKDTAIQLAFEADCILGSLQVVSLCYLRQIMSRISAL